MLLVVNSPYNSARFRGNIFTQAGLMGWNTYVNIMDHGNSTRCEWVTESRWEIVICHSLLWVSTLPMQKPWNAPYTISKITPFVQFSRDQHPLFVLCYDICMLQNRVKDLNTLFYPRIGSTVTNYTLIIHLELYTRLKNLRRVCITSNNCWDLLVA